MEDEFPEVRDGVFVLMDKNLVSSVGTGVSKVLCFKMKGDYHRCLAGFATGDAKSKPAEESSPERVSERSEERVVAMPVPQIMEEIVEVIQLVRQERILERIVEEIIDVPVPQVMEEITEFVKLLPQERVQNRTVEQIVDVPVPQIQ